MRSWLLFSILTSSAALAPRLRSAPTRLRLSAAVDAAADAERWFVKTETFSRPFPEVKPHLEAHRAWVRTLREGGARVTSGYRVDRDGRPGGGGMLFLRAPSFAAAEAVVRRDPLIANDCVDWRLNEWIGEVGGLELT